MGIEVSNGISSKVCSCQGGINKIHVDAIVNATNETLIWGWGWGGRGGVLMELFMKLQCHDY